MNFNWLTDLLPIINATGVPLLVIGILLLFRAYNKANQVSEEASKSLITENERLRRLITDTDKNYFDQVEKIKNVVSKSIEAIAELQARKISLLAKPEAKSNEEIFSDISKINQVVELIDNISGNQERVLDEMSRIREHATRLESEFKSQLKYLTIQSGVLAEQIGDTSSRLAIINIVASPSIYEQVKSVSSGIDRGLVPPASKKPELEKIDMEKIDEKRTGVEERLTIPGEPLTIPPGRIKIFDDTRRAIPPPPPPPNIGDEINL